jgi:hypothetical protein
VINPRIFFEAAIVVLFVIAGLFWLERRDAANAEDWHKAIAAAKAKTAADTKPQQTATAHYDTVEHNWISYRDRILHDTVSPPTAREREIFAHADTVRLAADTVIKTDTVVIHDLRVETKIAENPPSAPRLSYYGEALYDLVQRAPVGRVGATLRVFGPLDLSAAVGADLPASGERGVKTQALIGIRVRF